MDSGWMDGSMDGSMGGLADVWVDGSTYALSWAGLDVFWGQLHNQ